MCLNLSTQRVQESSQGPCRGLSRQEEENRSCGKKESVIIEWEGLIDLFSNK